MRRIRKIVAMAALLACAGTARAEYQLSSGDVLDITVFRVPELTRQATVDVDGRIAVPPLGLIEVRGHTLDDVSATISSLLTGRDILPDAVVTVGLASARPVFVGGDVVSPGSFPYQPELSVRRAITLAGGLGIAGAPDVYQIPELRGQQTTLTADLRRLETRITRLNAELAGEDSFDASAPDASGLEAEQLKASVVERAKEREHLERAVTLINNRIDTLVTQQGQQKQILLNQKAEMTRIREIQDRGLTNLARVQDEQRTYETMQERASDTAAQIAQVRSQLEDAQHALDRFDDRERTSLERQLQDASFAEQSTAAELRAIGERLAAAGFTAGQIPQVTIYRFRDGEEVTVPATEATPLEPGDMVTVALPIDVAAPGAAAAGQATATGQAGETAP